MEATEAIGAIGAIRAIGAIGAIGAIRAIGAIGAILQRIQRSLCFLLRTEVLYARSVSVEVGQPLSHFPLRVRISDSF